MIRGCPILASVDETMAEGWDNRASKGSETACACDTNNPCPRNPRRGVTADEIAETAIFWILRLLGKRFHGKYSPTDIASVLALAASRESSPSRICQEHELAPTEGVIRYRLRSLTLKPLLKRANRLLPKRPLKIAIDYTLIPYHGKPKRSGRPLLSSQTARKRVSRPRHQLLHGSVQRSPMHWLHGRRCRPTPSQRTRSYRCAVGTRRLSPSKCRVEDLRGSIGFAFRRSGSYQP